MLAFNRMIPNYYTLINFIHLLIEWCILNSLLSSSCLDSLLLVPNVRAGFQLLVVLACPIRGQGDSTWRIRAHFAVVKCIPSWYHSDATVALTLAQCNFLFLASLLLLHQQHVSLLYTYPCFTREQPPVHISRWLPTNCTTV